MSISAMKYALQALENPWGSGPEGVANAIAFLRQAIAEAEKQEPVAWREVAGKTTHYYEYNEDKRGEPLYAAPQPDLARVGEVGIWGDKREWVGLTDEERAECWSSSARQSAINIEAKLKEKNS
jgi:hypothetical protein